MLSWPDNRFTTWCKQPVHLLAHRCGQLRPGGASQDFAEAHARLVELRFGCADGAAQRLRDFVMFVAENVVQNKSPSVSARQFSQGALEVQTVYKAGDTGVDGSHLPYGQSLAIHLVGGVERRLVQMLNALPHQDDIDGQAVQPSGERRLRAKGVNLAEHLQEGLLRQILREGRVSRHAQANSVDAPAVFRVEMLEGGCVPGLCEPNDFQFGLLT